MGRCLVGGGRGHQFGALERWARRAGGEWRPCASDDAGREPLLAVPSPREGAAAVLAAGALAFTLGCAVRRGRVCMVLADEEWAGARRASRLSSFLLAACWSGAVLLPLAWLLPGRITLAPAYAPSVVVVLGAAVFALGAWFNGACAAGSLARLGGGDLSFVGTLLGGVAVGAASAALGLMHGPAPSPSPLMRPGILPLAALAAMTAVALRSACMARPWRPRGLRRPLPAVVLVGVAGGLLYAAAGDWTYLAVLSRRAAHLIDPMFPGSSWPVVAGAAAALLGGVAAAVVEGGFRLRAPAPALLARRVAAGATMGIGASLVPGGNDVVLLYGLPSLAPHALLAYPMMMATLLAAFAPRRRLTGARGCGVAAPF